MANSTFKKGIATHKTLRCGGCGGITVVRKEMVGRLHCSRCPGVLHIASAVEEK